MNYTGTIRPDGRVEVRPADYIRRGASLIFRSKTEAKEWLDNYSPEKLSTGIVTYELRKGD